MSCHPTRRIRDAGLALPLKGQTELIFLLVTGEPPPFMFHPRGACLKIAQRPSFCFPFKTRELVTPLGGIPTSRLGCHTLLFHVCGFRVPTQIKHMHLTRQGSLWVTMFEVDQCSGFRLSAAGWPRKSGGGLWFEGPASWNGDLRYQVP